ncbi:TraC family protein [Bradyrhizobium sp. CCBAU 11386]|uniref:TraC family protein n=1 Tax=Bradyrhizobium sp. CCBAU 11386 TaxID=1630837 RepID=UPI002304BC76|nr:TraC family protein [Bradyrhizobium sp. CCBAU 11386]
MKKPSRHIMDEIARLQEQLKQAETREAERIGRIALRAGLGREEPATAKRATTPISKAASLQRYDTNVRRSKWRKTWNERARARIER